MNPHINNHNPLKLLERVINERQWYLYPDYEYRCICLGCESTISKRLTDGKGEWINEWTDQPHTNDCLLVAICDSLGIALPFH